MLGVNYIKAQPTTYLMQYVNGTVKRCGTGLSFLYFAPTTSLVAVPLESRDIPFMFAEVTSDQQEVTIQGYATYRIAEPEQTTRMMNFTLTSDGKRYASEDPEKFPQRILQLIQVQVRGELQKLKLRDALGSSEEVSSRLLKVMRESGVSRSLGLDILGLSVVAIKPTPETARALEAEAREQILLEADNAIYARRKAAVEQERTLKETELNTEIAVEKKKRQVKEEKMEAEISVQRMRSQIREERLETDIQLEEKRLELVTLAAENANKEADAQAYALTATVKPLADLDAKKLQALAGAGMNPSQLIALSFQSLAENADKIGQLNVSPDLLRELLEDRGKNEAANG